MASEAGKEFREVAALMVRQRNGCDAPDCGACAEDADLVARAMELAHEETAHNSKCDFTRLASCVRWNEIVKGGAN